LKEKKMAKPIYVERMDTMLSTQPGAYQRIFASQSGKAEIYGKEKLADFFREQHYWEKAKLEPAFKGLYRQDKSDELIYNEAKEVKSYLDKKRLDNSGVFFERDTTFTDPQFYSLKYKPLGKWRNWFVTQNVPLGAEYVRYKQYEKTGDGANLATRGDRNLDLKRTNAKEYLNKQHVYNEGFYFTYAEIRAYLFANADVDRAEQENAANNFEITAHKNMILGDSTIGITGMINATNVPNVQAAAPASGSDRTWNGGDKTNDEVVQDIVGMPKKIIEDNKSAYGEDGFVVGLPVAKFNYITSTRLAAGTDTTIAAHILENFKGEQGQPVIKGFVIIHELAGQGNGSSDLAICFKPNEGEYIKARINDQVIFHPPVFEPLSIVYAMEQEMSGLTIMHPLSMTQLYGI
jgi:hypothetical protein